MQKVKSLKKPPDFEKSVAIPGRQFLRDFVARKGRGPKSREWGKHDHWKNVIDYLAQGYDSVCVYSCFRVLIAGEVDHFRSKSVYYNRAYRWSNLLFSDHTANNLKPTVKQIFDPRKIKNDWFVLNVWTGELHSTAKFKGKTKKQRELMASTLEYLNKPKLKKARIAAIKDHLAKAPSAKRLAVIDEVNPFIARTLRRHWGLK